MTGGGAAYRGFGGTSGAVRSGYTPGSPGSGAWRGGRGYGRYGYGGWGWGWGIGPGYWGFGNPYWYGGFPFWYDTLAYGTYWNPYYTNANDYGGYDYGAPIQQSQNPNQGPEDNQFFSQARAAFYAGNYQEALKDIEHAAIDMPRNEDIHQFHALVYLALGDYPKAAAVAHTVLDMGPGWNWSVVQSFYPSPDVYTQQLRALEHSITEHGDQASTRFLLGYEYLMLGHFKAADRQFQRVVALEPRDTLAKNILNGLNNAPGVKANALPGTVSSQPSNPGTPAGTGQPVGQPASNAASQTTAMPPNGVAPGTPQGQPIPPVPVNPGGPAPAITGSWKASPARSDDRGDSSAR